MYPTDITDVFINLQQDSSLACSHCISQGCGREDQMSAGATMASRSTLENRKPLTSLLTLYLVSKGRQWSNSICVTKDKFNKKPMTNSFYKVFKKHLQEDFVNTSFKQLVCSPKECGQNYGIAIEHFARRLCSIPARRRCPHTLH